VGIKPTLENVLTDLVLRAPSVQPITLTYRVRDLVRSVVADTARRPSGGRSVGDRPHFRNPFVGVAPARCTERICARSPRARKGSTLDGRPQQLSRSKFVKSAARWEDRSEPGVYTADFSHTETCCRLVLVNGSRAHPPHRARSLRPAIFAIRSSSAGHTKRRGVVISSYLPPATR
jgi:hypothetical protein